MDTTYCSDLLYLAMGKAQQQAMNQFNFKTLRHILNQQWRYVYEMIARIEGGYYNEKIRLTELITHLPPICFRTVNIYTEDPFTGARSAPYRHGDNNQYCSPGIFYIEGNDLRCWDARYRGDLWLEYTPAPKPLFFTANNRTPEYLQNYTQPVFNNQTYHSYRYAVTGGRHILTHMGNANMKVDITPVIDRGTSVTGALYTVERVIMDYPYVFVTYKHKTSGQYSSYILKNVLGAVERIRFNPFDYTGRISNVSYCEVHHNEDNGMYAIVKDWDDTDPETGNVPAIKKIGWTPDTVMTFPQECVFDLVMNKVAMRLADRNESELKVIQKDLEDSEKEFRMWIKKDSNLFYKVQNSVGRRISDTLIFS